MEPNFATMTPAGLDVLPPPAHQAMTLPTLMEVPEDDFFGGTLEGLPPTPAPDKNGEFATPADGAKFMASFGIPQVPLSAPTDTRFPNPGKNPAINGSGWQHKASTDPAQIDRWCETFPGCNFGSLATADGGWCFEADSKTPYERYKRDTGRKFTRSLGIESGSRKGGFHLWLRQSPESRAMGNVPQTSDNQLSCRVSGEQCVSPGSIHVSGKQYRVVVNMAPVVAAGEDIAWLNTQRTTTKTSDGKVMRPAGWMDAPIIHGAINNSMYAIAAHLRHAGLNEPAILPIILEKGRTQCFHTDGVTRFVCNEDDLVKVVQSACKDLSTDEQRLKNMPTIGKKTPEEFFFEGKLAEVRARNPKATSQPAETPAKAAVLRRADQVTMKKLRWLWQYRIPLGKITAFAGNPDQGKSLATACCAATITTGTDWPDSKNTFPPSEVLILSGEDDPEDTLVPRLTASGADLSKVHILHSTLEWSTTDGKASSTEREIQLDVDLQRLEEVMQQHPDIRFIVIDPITDYLGSAKMIDEKDVRQKVLTPLRNFAARHNVAIAMVMHLNKKVDLDAIHRISGAMAFSGVARSAWLFVADPDDKDIKYMLKVKNNLAKTVGGMRYRIYSKPIQIEGSDEYMPYIQWDGVVEKDANDMLFKSGEKKEVGRPSVMQEAGDWLSSFLREGPRLSDDVFDFGKGKEGLSRSTLQRAAKVLEIESYRKGSKWWWRLPGDESDDSLENPPITSQLLLQGEVNDKR
ncbi:MAG: AAA family ATPase [Candidatus Acidiferrales bacterium]